MITVPTTLVLGAGASKPYGYPLGAELLAEIARGDDELDEDLAALDFEPDEIEDFRRALAESGVGSVDTYLARVARHLEIGRIALAHQMLHHDARAGDFASDWLGYLWRLLIEDVTRPDRLAGNRLSIVTFNYDTSVERFLVNAIRHTFDVPTPDAVRFAEAIRVVHVYGRLSVQQSVHRIGPVPATAAAAREAAQKLIVLHEGVDDSREFQLARELLAQAQVRFFLGFGFLKENVERLKVRSWLLTGTRAPLASTFGMTEGERRRMQRLFPNSHPVSTVDGTCLDAVREWVDQLTT